MARSPSAWQSGLDASREERRAERVASELRPLEPLLPGETRSEYLARVDRDENEAWLDWFGRAQPFDGVEEAFRAGFRAARRASSSPLPRPEHS
jgi:hypothetical protein